TAASAAVAGNRHDAGAGEQYAVAPRGRTGCQCGAGGYAGSRPGAGNGWRFFSTGQCICSAGALLADIGRVCAVVAQPAARPALADPAAARPIPGAALLAVAPGGAG